MTDPDLYDYARSHDKHFDEPAPWPIWALVAIMIGVPLIVAGGTLGLALLFLNGAGQ